MCGASLAAGGRNPFPFAATAPGPITVVSTASREPVADPSADWQLTSVADDSLVFHRAGPEPEVDEISDLDPGADYEFHGIAARTLERPPGELLCRFATVNDVHFGETLCGYVHDARELIEYVPETGSPFGTRAEILARWDDLMAELGPLVPMAVGPGEPPYPQLMNRAAIEEISRIEPVAVLVKGDLTSAGLRSEYEEFAACYEPAFGEQLMVVRGNHDAMAGERFEDTPFQERELPGVTVALLDTVVEGRSDGACSPEQIEQVDELAARADRPVLVFGHHHVWDPGSPTRPDAYFGIRPVDSEPLVSVVARRSSIVGYFAGHTHRNKVRHFAATGELPWVEVTTVKDFPGCWAEYRVFEGGVIQIARRISTPAALAWSERCRAMFWGLYPMFVTGSIQDRCFAF